MNNPITIRLNIYKWKINKELVKDDVWKMNHFPFFRSTLDEQCHTVLWRLLLLVSRTPNLQSEINAVSGQSNTIIKFMREMPHQADYHSIQLYYTTSFLLHAMFKKVHPTTPPSFQCFKPFYEYMISPS